MGIPSWQIAAANVASMIGGLFALVALVLYLQPVAHVTIGTYGYVLGTGNRQWYVTFRNVGNVAVRTVRFSQQASGRSWVELQRHFENRVVERGDDITALLTEQDMKAVEWIEIRYRGNCVPISRTTRKRFDLGKFAVAYVENPR